MKNCLSPQINFIANIEGKQTLKQEHIPNINLLTYSQQWYKYYNIMAFITLLIILIGN